MNLITIFFWFSILSLIYIYVGYPVLIKLIGVFIKRPVKKNDSIRYITLIIAAFNEEKSIESKIKNCLSLDYQKNLFDIIVVSDGSTDRTDEIVKKYKNNGIQLLRVEGRKGKTFAQNFAVEKAKGEILIFSDATTVYKENAIKKIIRPFADPLVGCVSGKLTFQPRNDSLFSGEKNTSEKYDQNIKTIESDIHSIYGVNGCFYAVRRELYDPIPDYVTSDFVVPLQIVKKKYRVVFEPEAICYEEPCKDALGEFRRKIRTSRAGITGMFYMRDLLNPFQHFWTSFVLFNHKIIRWLSPIILICTFILNILCFNEGTFYFILFIIQLLLYFFAFLGFLNEKIKHKFKILTIPFNFMLINLAALIGFMEFLRGNISEAWETNRV
ncbi:Glycosyl transferase, family II [Candidatus Magnetomoraceae bacterium gMMP-15]